MEPLGDDLRSDAGISAIFASTIFSSSALLEAALSSLARSFIASRSSAEKRLDVLLFAAVRLAGFCVSFTARSSWDVVGGTGLEPVTSSV